MDVSSRHIENIVQQKQYDTYQVNGSTSNTHHMYVDDVLLFTKTNIKSFKCINKTLEDFTSFISLKSIGAKA